MSLRLCARVDWVGWAGLRLVRTHEITAMHTNTINIISHGVNVKDVEEELELGLEPVHCFVHALSVMDPFPFSH